MRAATQPRRTGPRRLRVGLAAARVAGFVIVGLAGAFAGGFGLFATYVSELSTPRDIPPADAIIVLTGGQSRLDAAVDLLRSGKGKRLLISGVNPVANRESLRAVTGAERRLFDCCVDIDHAALDTVGNAVEGAKWVRSHAYGSVILVTNNYHMPRSLLEMSRLAEGTRLQPYPVVNTNISGGDWMRRPEAVRVILTEYAKYLAAVGRMALGISRDEELHPDTGTATASVRP